MLSNTYYTLIGSLPALPRHFEEADRVPVSSISLSERLKMLKPKDANTISLMADFLVWDRQPIERTNEDVIKNFERFVTTVDNKFAKEHVRFIFTLRTIVSALRSRRLDRPSPGGIEPLATRIAKHWEYPDFGLGGKYPWIVELDKLLNGPNPFDMQRKQLNVIWSRLARLSENYHFTFEAVVVYLIRWEVVYRWSRRTAEVGRRKFEQLVSEAIGEFADIFPAELE